MKQLVAQAEQSDRAPLQDGLSLPAEIARRQERKVALTQTRAGIEARAQARYTPELSGHGSQFLSTRKLCSRRPRPRSCDRVKSCSGWR